MKDLDKLLLDILGNALFDTKITIPENVDYASLLTETKMQAVTPLVYDVLQKQGCLSPAEKEEWQNTTFFYIYVNENLLTEQQAVLSILKEAAIPCAVLKGSSSAVNYPDPALRVMGDIDLLVPPNRQEETVALMQQHGYRQVPDDHSACHQKLCKGRIILEIHKQPNGLTKNKDEAIAVRLENLFSNALSSCQWVNGIPLLADLPQAMVLLLHKLEHFLARGLGLRQLCDWAVFVRARLTPALWDELEPILAKCGLLQFTGIITRVCVDYLHLDVSCAPWAMDYDPLLSAEVIEEILSCGNFGRKEAPYGEHFFLDIDSKNRVSSFGKVFFAACKRHWPFAARHPIVMPIAPFVLGGQYLAGRLNGKQDSFHIVARYKAANAKRQLYNNLKPFVID